MQFTLIAAPPACPTDSITFRPPGGTIGRSSDNDLVLPDDDRAISRLQAVVHLSAAGDCRLTNYGSVTPVLLNAQPLACGDQVVLRNGDVLTIGHYAIQVGEPAAPHGSGEPQAAELCPPRQAAPSGTTQSAAHQRLSIDPLASMPPDRAAPAADQPRLVSALLEGMGLDLHGQPGGLDEEQMRMTGRMLSLFAQGTVALLSSRSILKRGVKAEMTLILNEANNPFKILPSGKTVLMQMYQSEMPGFMAPETAVRDALVDLQAHQLGMIAGIRAIIAAMLQSFHPQRLEELAQREGLAPKFALSGGRKAAMWSFFERHYQHTAGEIEDDFHTLFGEAFLHAYDTEVHQYKDSQNRTDAS
ncbi:type VI secretion system-associated FHA domain protein TagH [Pantoea sp. 1.19]|uniref:type VI secretion system-associated FHA domain protein TagH n=1 Tax=Pantoea sp. 1.19 TaxID=1925589 RepID=UPI0009488BBF|nr:type VI secretion system-associated FHA domain protein TagH [Pantoea sp. 1.19]